jgi:hypothetical protein
VLAEQFGAAVDARGDVWCWGDGYEGDTADGERSGKAGRSLRGKVRDKTTKTYTLWKERGDQTPEPSFVILNRTSPK